MFVNKKIESYVNNRLTFLNIHGRTSRRIYRLALLLRTPETLSSSSKSRIFLYNVHLALFSYGRHNYPHKYLGKYHHLVNLN